MTHDELMDYIDKFDCAGMVNEPIVKALRAVVELHKPDQYGGTTCQAHEQCWGCGEWGGSDICPCNAYPCPTILEIEKELR